MRFEFTGCCFRIELELFPLKMAIRKYRLGPAAETLAVRRKMLRQLHAKLKSKDVVPALPDGSSP